MQNRVVAGLAVLVVLLLVGAGQAQPPVAESGLPLPPTVAGLPSTTAELWLQVDQNPLFLEGPAFDRQGNLFVTSVFDHRVLKITPDKTVSTIFIQEGLLPDGIAIHKDGRLFLACISGRFLAINPDGGAPMPLEPRHAGKPAVGNDLVFDREGNLYVTDWTGSVAEATGGVYRFAADFKSIQPVIGNLVTPNGIALSPDGRTLWVSETSRNQLLALNLQEDGLQLDPFEGTKIPWRFTGCPGGPDSNAVDQAGNLYQAVIFQGRALIFNKNGIPVANVLVPGRDQGRFLRTTNLAFKPGTDEVYLTASGEGGAAVFRFKGLAAGLTLFSHQ